MVGPPQLVPCLTAGSIQATIFLGYSQLRTEQGRLIGTLLFTSGEEFLQENLRKFWPVSEEPQSACRTVLSSYPILLFRMSGALPFKVFPHLLLLSSSSYPYSFFQK